MNMQKKQLWLFGCAVAAVDLWLLFSQPAPIPRASLGLSEAALAEPAAAAVERRVATSKAPQQAFAGAAASGPAASPRDSTPPRLLPPRFAARPDGEWKGMLVNLNAAPPCETSAGCGLARACKDSRCVACSSDMDCATGEACVLDHCVRSEQVSCRERQDCGPDSVCMLSGYSTDLRGNRDMQTLCSDRSSGADRSAARTPVAVHPRGAPGPAPYADLFESARRALPAP
jgi:hypothetical protein